MTNRYATKPLSNSHKAYIEQDEEQYSAQTDDTDERDPLNHDYRRISTVNVNHAKPRSNHSRQIELPLDDSNSSPPSSSSSDKQPNSTRPNSVFLQLIACGAAAVSGNRKSGGVVSRLDELRRYSGPAVQDKEYFSGSILVEEGRRGPSEPVLKKSNSYNEERRARLGIGEDTIVEEENGGVIRATDGVKGKCIPVRSKKSSAKLASSPLMK